MPEEGSICSGSNPKGLARAQAVVHLHSAVDFSLMYEIVNHPKAAQQERALLSTDAVRRFTWQIPVEQTVSGAESLLNGEDSGYHARVVGRDDAS